MRSLGFFLVVMVSVTLPGQELVATVKESSKGGLWEGLDSLDLNNPEEAWIRAQAYHQISLSHQDRETEQAAVREAVLAYRMASADELLGQRAELQLKQLWMLKMNDGSRAYENQDMDVASHKFELGTLIEPADSTGYLYLATVRSQMGDIQGLVDAYESLIQYHPQPHHVMVLIQTYRSLDEPQKALTVLDTMAHLSTSLIIQAIEIHMDLLQFDETLKWINKLATQSSGAEVLLRQALVYEAMEAQANVVGNDTLGAQCLAEAGRYYSALLQKEETNYIALFNLALLKHRSANHIYEDLRQLSREAYAVQRESELARAELLLKEAVVHMRRAVELRPDDVRAWLALETFYTQLDWPSSLKEVSEVLTKFNR